jgi:N-acetylglucosaminyl-diphospho-decaprenol L-rhamnosyltransferase
MVGSMTGGMLAAIGRKLGAGQVVLHVCVSTENAAMHDVCAIVVSHNGKRWLDTALSSLYAHSGEIDLDVVVVDNGDDGSAAYVEGRFPEARTLRCENRGFGHANNRGLETADARYVLFLNPDTEFLSGRLEQMVAAFDQRPELGLAGVRQLRDDDSLAPSIRRFPSRSNALAEALGVERFGAARRRFGERELDLASYERETPCDWTSGSFMFVRGEALEDVGWFDERFFLFSEETDLCWRLKESGWEIVHMPDLTIRHYEQEHWQNARLEAQSAYARMQFARKNLPGEAAGYRRALALRYGLRVLACSLPGRQKPQRRRAARAALTAALDEQPPFGAVAEPSRVVVPV